MSERRPHTPVGRDKTIVTRLVLASLRHGRCVNCGVMTPTLGQAMRHWDSAMESERGRHNRGFFVWR